MQSRCSIFKFRSIEDTDISNRIKFIAEYEKKEITTDAITAILRICKGDLRRAITILQAAAIGTDHITESIIYAIEGKSRIEEVRNILKLALSGRFLEARDEITKLLTSTGISGADLLELINEEVNKLQLSDLLIARLIDITGEISYYVATGVNEIVALNLLLARFALLGEKEETINREDL